MEITAAVARKPRSEFQIEALELDEPGPGEALVRVVASGLCHTDISAINGNFPIPLPAVFGHEGAGEVVAVGPDVTKVRLGDHVVMGWPWCGTCRNCRAGEPRYCLNLEHALWSGSRLLGPRAGEPALHDSQGVAVRSHFFGQSSFATHALSWADHLVVVPREAPLELLAALACGLGSGAGAVMTALRPGPGTSLAVFGAGAVGLAAVMAAALSPATTIVVIDRHDERLSLALDLGATHVVNADAEDAVAAVHRFCGGPADFALECTGVLVRQAVDSIGMLGTCVLLGGGPAGSEFTLDHRSTLWGKRIVGNLGGGGRSEQIIGALTTLYLQGRFPIDRLVRRYSMTDINLAVEDVRAGRTIKPVLVMDR
jgi:aryl-alcohol dehydrogenase